MAGWLSALLEDARQAVRELLRHPGVSAAVVALLGVGVGVSTVAFSTAYGLLLRPLPWVDGHRMVRIETPRDGQPERRGPLFRRQFEALEEAAGSFSQVAAYVPRALAWVGPDGPEELQGASVSRSLLPLLQGTLHLGQPFAEAGGRGDLVLLSHGAWRRRFGGDPAVVGAVVELGGRPYTVAGVLSEGIDFPGPETAFWIPIVPSSIPGSERALVPMSAVGRLKPGVSADRAQVEVRAILGPIGGGLLAPVRVIPLREALYGVYRPALSVLTAAAGALLLLVGASVAGLLLVRLSGRRRELAMRGVLGAAPGRIARGSLVENVVLSLAGGAVGLAAAALLQQVVRALVPAASAPLAAGAGAAPAVAFAASAGVGLCFGAAPALAWLRGGFFRPLQAASAHGGGGVGLPGANRVRAALVVAQIAAALALLVAAGLLLRSFVRFATVNPGHDAGAVLTARVGSPTLPNDHLDGVTPEQGDASYVSKQRFYDALARGLPRLEALPEVEAVGLSSTLPLTEATWGTTFRVVGGASGDPERLPWVRRQTLASPGYFEVLRPHLRAGRLFGRRDTAGSPRAAIVNETFARSFLPEAAVGARLILRPDTRIPRPVDVVGVVADFEVPGGGGSSPPEIFLAASQLDYFGWPDEMFVSVSTAGDPQAVVPFLRRALAEVDPRAVLKDVRTLRERRSDAVAEPRFYAAGAGLIAAFALVLAACSLYGVLSYSVWQRRREFGVRLALGAQRGDVFRLVLRQGAALVATGVALGLAAGAAAARLIESLLFGVTPMDLPTVAAAVAVLAAVAAAAGYVPARRAVSGAPMDVLRCE